MKVAIYCRLSEEDKNKQTKTDDSESIQNQKNMLIEFSLKNGWDIYDIYSDDDFKGADRNRPEFKRILEDAEQRKFDIVLCKTQSRFTRELELVEKYIHGKFIEWNIRFIGYADNADTENMGNKKQRQINGLVNEWYLEDLSNSIKSVFDTKKRAGQHIGSFALYGYKKDPEKKGRIIIDEEAAKIVREVFELFVQGYGKTNIARILNERGIPNPTEYKRQKGLRYKTKHNKNSTLWKYFSISNMLENEMYIGTMVQNKQKNASYKSGKKLCLPESEWIKIPNMHEPIIDIELWNQAQNLIAKRFKPWGDTKKIGVFAKKVKCIYCGYYMRTQKTRGNRYLQCATSFISKETCPGVMVSVNTLEKAVLKGISELREVNGIETNEINNKVVFESRLQDNLDSLRQDIIFYTKKIAEATEAIKSLYLDKLKKIITDDEFIEFSREFHQDKDKFKRLIEISELEIEQVELKLKNALNKEDLLDKYKDIETLERIHTDALIDYIEVSRRFPKSVRREINIAWNF